MSRSLAAITTGSSNRRFIMLAIALGLVGAILVYVAASRGSSTSGGGPADTAVVVAKTDIPARTKITQSMIEVRLVAADSASQFAFTDVAEVVDQVTRFPIAANEQVLTTKVVELSGSSSASSRSLSFVVPQGRRGIAVNITQVQNAGGLVLPGDYVDVLVVYDVDFRTGEGSQTEDSFIVMTLFQNIEVLAVSQTVVDIVPAATATAGSQRVRNSESKPTPDAATVTLALTPEEAQRIYLAESNGRLRLSVRPFGDAEARPIDPLLEIDLFPPNLPNPFVR